MDNVSFNKIKGTGFASILALSIFAPQYTVDANTDEQQTMDYEENTIEEYQTEEPYYNEETVEENYYEESTEENPYENPYTETLPEEPVYESEEEFYEEPGAEEEIITYQGFAPEIRDVSVSGQTFEPGDTVTLTLSGAAYNTLAGAAASFQSTSDSGSAALDITSFNITELADGSFNAVGTYQIPEDFDAASYTLAGITLTDEFGNYSEISSDYLNFDVAFDITAPAPEDTAAPELINVYTDKNTYTPGETVTVTVEATDESEINQMWGSFIDMDGDTENTPYQVNNIYITQNAAGNHVGTGTFVIDEDIPDAAYQLNQLSLTDVHGNENRLNSYNGNPVATFNIAGETENNPPELVDVSADKDLYEVGETVKVTVTVEDESEVIGVTANFADVDGDSEDVYSTELTGIEEDEDGNYIAAATLHIPEKLSSSTVQLESVSIVDIHENAVKYDGEDTDADIAFTVAEISENAPSPSENDAGADESAAEDEEESAGGGILPDTGIFSEQVVLPVLVLLIFGVTVLLATLRMRKTN